MSLDPSNSEFSNSESSAAEPSEQVAEQIEASSAIPTVPGHVNKQIFQSSLRALLLLEVALVVLGSVVGFLVGGTAGIWGALLGAAVTLLFSGTTIWSMLYTANKSPNATMAIVMGAWIAKMLVFVIVMAILGHQEFFHKIIFAVIVLIGVIGSALLDMRAVTQGRMPYVTP